MELKTKFWACFITYSNIYNEVSQLDFSIVSFVCLFDLILTSHQQSFSYVETGLPGLNQY